MKRSLSVVTLTLLLILALLAAAVIANDAHMNEDENLRGTLLYITKNITNIIYHIPLI